MVGVRGKFAGCETCRDRRVKCDNQRPVCRKCINTGRDCRGYERTHTWIVATLADQGRVSSHDKRVVNLSNSNTVAPLPINTSQGKKASDASDVSQILEASPPNLFSHVSNVPSNEIQMLALHSNILTLETLFESNYGSGSLPSLLHCLTTLTSNSPVLEYAVKALCLIHLGVTKKKDDAIKESAHINNKAVARMRKAIDTPKTATNIETLAASICLYLYEQVACTAEKGVTWRILFQGSSFLIRQRGPSSFKKFPDHHFFVRLFRNDACFDAMSRSKRTYLAEPEWLTVPWEEIPKSDMDRLFDIQFQLPAIFEREAQLENQIPSTTRKAAAQKLLDRSYKVIQMFEDWYDELHARSKEPISWFIPRQAHKEGSVQNLGFDMCFLFPNYLQFVNLNTAFLHLYYWAALSLIYHKIQEIHHLMVDDVTEISRLSPESSKTRLSPDLPEPVLALKRKIATSSPLFTSPIESSPGNGPFPPLAISSKPLISIFLANPTAEASNPCHPAPLNPKYSEDSILSLAYLICKSLPYVLNRTLHSLGPDHSAWPVWCALQIFKRRKCTAELEWCTKMLDMWGRQGWKFGGQMGRVEWE